MNQDEIKKEIKDLSYGIQFHREQGDYHHGVADRRLASIKGLEAQLAEAEKPELRHGDVKFYKGKADDPVVYLNGRWFSDEDELSEASCDNCKDFPVEFNIFDNLKARQEPLEKFRIDNGTSQTIRVKISGGFLRMRDDDGFMLIKECELPAFILNLQRLVITEKEASGE